jgi:hypothetical protein
MSETRINLPIMRRYWTQMSYMQGDTLSAIRYYKITILCEGSNKQPNISNQSDSHMQLLGQQ